jgi:DNA-binding transcriptional LysR family regulator
MCSPGYLKEARAQHKALNKPEDLRHHVMLYLHDPTGRWPWLSWARWLEYNGVEELTPTSSLTFDLYDQVLNAAVHGQGVALGRMSLAQEHLREKRLIALFGRSQRLARAYHAVLAKGAPARPEVMQFVEWMKREIAPAAVEAAA